MGQRGGSDVGDSLDLCDCGLSVANNTALRAMNRHAQKFHIIGIGTWRKGSWGISATEAFLDPSTVRSSARHLLVLFDASMELHSTSPGPLDGELGRG